MSLLSKVFKKAKGLVRKAGPIASLIPGPIGAGAMALTAMVGPGSKAGRVSTPPVFQPLGMLPSLPAIGSSIGRALPAIGGAVVRTGAAGARSVYNAAANYCRKHPQWCSTVGGIAAVEAMIGRGELPIPKRRRGRGITATELKNFKRVARFTSKYCAPVRRAMSAPAVKRGGRSCR